MAIQSLSTYASVSTAFVIVAPTVTHRDTGRECDTETYNKRMCALSQTRHMNRPSCPVNSWVAHGSRISPRRWCRAENLCFSLRNGIEAMFLATEQGLQHQAEDVEFMASNLRVMEGDATVETQAASGPSDPWPLRSHLREVAGRKRARGEEEGRG